MLTKFLRSIGIGRKHLLVEGGELGLVYFSIGKVLPELVVPVLELLDIVVGALGQFLEVWLFLGVAHVDVVVD